MNKMINRYKSKEGGTMIPLRFQNGGSNLFLTMPNGGNVGPLGASPMGLPEYQTGANYGYPMMQDGGDADMDGDDQSFYSNRMNTFIQKIRDAAEKNLGTAIMEQDQQQPMAAYGMSMNSDPMNSYDPGNLGAFARTANYMKDLGQGAISGYIQRMGALGPNDYYYKEKNIYKDTSKNAPLGSQLFTDADGNQSMISPEEAYNRSNYALYSRKRGGSLPTAQDGLAGIASAINDPELYRRALEMGHNSIDEYKNSNWGYGKNHPEYKAPATYPSRVRINDPRTINATSGNPINPNADLKSGTYHTGVIGEIARAAKEYNLDPQELMAIALQESNLGKTDPNYGHVLDYRDPQHRGAGYDLAFAKTKKNEVADKAGYTNDELRRIQAYNGLGTVYPSTESDYHGFNMSSIYGVPLTSAGINMVSNPLYGKRIVDLRDNVLKNPTNAEYNKFLDKYNRDLANEEGISKKQIAAYNAFNMVSPEYGNQFADMMQKTYQDSIDNSLDNEYVYPSEGPGWTVPNLDNMRQWEMLDRFNKGIGQSFLYKDGGALTKYQQDINSGQPGTTEGDYWTAEETAYLNTLPKAQRDAIISKGDKGREAYQAYRKANDKPASVSKSTTATQPSATANNTGTGVTTGTTATTTNPPATTTTTPTTTTPAATTGFEGWTKTTINGVEYAVNDKNEVIGYPYQAPTGPQGYYNNYNPYGAYNPYAAYGSMRGRNLGVISKNRLTPEFRENMLAGSYGNPQLLGISEIKTRRAMDPGNRIKSMTFSYGQPIPSGRTTINQPAANTSTQTSSGSSSTTPSKPTSAPVNPSASTLTPDQKIQQAMDFTFRSGQGPYNTEPDFPGLEKPRVGPWDVDNNPLPVTGPSTSTAGLVPPTINNTSLPKPATPSYIPPAFDANRTFGQIAKNEQNYFSTEGDMNNPDWRSQKIDNVGSIMYDTPKKSEDAWNRIKNNPANDSNDAGRAGLTKDQVAKEFDKVPAPLKDIAMDHLFNAKSDPRIFTLAAAGAIDMKDSLKYKDDPKLLENVWAKNIDLINQQYKDDPQAFTSAVSDYRKIIYAKSRVKGTDQYGRDLDTKSTTGMPGLQYNAWAGRTGNTQDYIDQTYFNPASGYTSPQYFKKDGGALRKFMRMYQGDVGPSSVRDMSIADLPETVDQIVAPESNNTPMDFNPYEMTDADRIRAVDVGTEYEQLEPGDGMAPSFDVTTKRRKKRIGNPEKDLAFISMAKKLFNRDAAYADTEYRRRSQASENFNPMRSMEGNYDILSGDFRRGKRAADGNDAFHSGFGNYAQMGGSMLDNLKEGDEVYLTEEQINEIVKRGGKLSYL